MQVLPVLKKAGIRKKFDFSDIFDYSDYTGGTYGSE
jgi:hypothetical protein